MTFHDDLVPLLQSDLTAALSLPPEAIYPGDRPQKVMTGLPGMGYSSCGGPPPAAAFSKNSRVASRTSRARRTVAVCSV